MPNEVFIFSPERMVPETLPPEPAMGTSMNGWQFSSRPNIPYQRRFRVRLHGLKWYLDPATDVYEPDIDPPFNARRLEEFYEEHQTWKPFDFYHPHLGLLTVKFAAPVMVPAAPVGSGGWLDAVEVTLAEHNPVFKTSKRPLPALNPITLSNTTPQTYAYWTATLVGKSTGSKVTVTSSDGTKLSVNGSTVSGTFITTGAKTLTIVEPLAGTSNTPRTSTVVVNVSIQKPRNDSAPTISGSPVIGQTLTIDTGVWAFNPTFTFQFYRNGTPVGISDLNYVLGNADDNALISADVIATNATGTTTIRTLSVGPVKPVFVPSLDNTYANNETVYVNRDGFRSEFQALEARFAALED